MVTVDDVLGTDSGSFGRQIAIAGLRAIAHGEMTYRQNEGEYGTLDDLATGDPPYVSDVEVAAGAKDGYSFDVVSADKAEFRAVAMPLSFGESGVRSFFIHESGMMRFTSNGSTPDGESPQLD